MTNFTSQPHRPSHVFVEDYKKIMQIHKRITSDLSLPMPTIQTLADEVAMSHTKFRNMFSKVFDCTIYQYHLKARMTLAQELLCSGKYTIVQVAYKTGFSRSQSFAKAFRKYYGVTASEYRASK